jgi:hypothetical protein
VGAPGATINTAIAMACCFGVSSPFTAHSKAIALSLLNLPSSADRVVEIFLRPASRDQMIQRGVLAGGRGREDLAAMHGLARLCTLRSLSSDFGPPTWPPAR